VTEDVKELSKEVSLMVARRDFQEGLNRIEHNQKTIFERLTSSTTGIKAEHAEMLRSLLRDYKKVFDIKLGMVNRHDDELKRLTTQLKTKISAYNMHIRMLRKAVKEADIARQNSNLACERMNKAMLLYNEKSLELNDEVLRLRKL